MNETLLCFQGSATILDQNLEGRDYVSTLGARVEKGGGQRGVDPWRCEREVWRAAGAERKETFSGTALMEVGGQTGSPE